jgi:hypothetical protein
MKKKFSVLLLAIVLLIGINQDVQAQSKKVSHYEHNEALYKNTMALIVDETKAYYKPGQTIDEFVNALEEQYTTLNAAEKKFVNEIYSFHVSKAIKAKIIKDYDGKSMVEVAKTTTETKKINLFSVNQAQDSILKKLLKQQRQLLMQ